MACYTARASTFFMGCKGAVQRVGKERVLHIHEAGQRGEGTAEGRKRCEDREECGASYHGILFYCCLT